MATDTAAAISTGIGKRAAADPVGTGLVQSLARPGGNVTGVSGAVSELSAKNLELIREVLPQARRVAMLANRADPFHTLLIHNVRRAAERLALQLDAVLAQAGDDFAAHFAAMKAAGAGAVLVQPTLPLREVAEAAVKARLPAASPGGPFSRAGGLMSYSADVASMQDQTVMIVDKVLKGRKPADLPVEIATRFRLTVNAKAAAAIGLTLPPLLLMRADEVME